MVKLELCDSKKFPYIEIRIYERHYNPSSLFLDTNTHIHIYTHIDTHIECEQTGKDINKIP